MKCLPTVSNETPHSPSNDSGHFTGDLAGHADLYSNRPPAGEATELFPMNQGHTRTSGRIKGWLPLSLATALIAAFASSAWAQSVLTEIYNSGVITLGADESLQLTIVNNNNVSDPALPNLSSAAESCTFVAQFLDANANPLQKQQQTLQPGQSFSFTQSGETNVQARVDVSPGTSSGFGEGISSQCVVTSAVVKTSSADLVLFAPLSRSDIPPSSGDCKQACFNDCAYLCRPVPTPSGVRAECGKCRKACEAECK